MRKNVNGRLMNCKEIKNSAIFRLRNHRNFRGLQSNKTDILYWKNKQYHPILGNKDVDSTIYRLIKNNSRN